MDTSGVAIALPKYRCHKEVWALKIQRVVPDGADDPTRESDGSAPLEFVESPPYAPRRVSWEYVRKHAPKAGGYWVQYADGYESWSPADVFEAGYRRVE